MTSSAHGDTGCDLLVVMQSLHTLDADRPKLAAVHVGMVSLVASPFARVTIVAPVGDANPAHDTEHPPPTRFVVAFTRQRRDRAWTVLAKYGAGVWRAWRSMRGARLVHVRLPGHLPLASGMVAILTGRPLLTSVHGSPAAYLTAGRRRTVSGLWRWAGAALLQSATRFVVRRSQLVLVSGDGLRRILGVDAVVLGHHQFRRADLFDRDDTCAGPLIRLIYVGRMSRDKGTDVLLDAFEKLRRIDPAYRLVLVGDSDGIDIEEDIARRALGDAVEYHRYRALRPDLLDLYRSADMLVFPSLHEGIPKVPLEAMSQGVPVVVSAPATGGYVEDGRNGLVVPAGDVDALVSAVLRLRRDAGLRRACIREGLATANRHCREAIEARVGEIVRDRFHLEQANP